MKNHPMFDMSKVIRATERKPIWFWRLINWWRRIIGRDRYYVGVDYAKAGESDCWAKAVYDTKTGTITILEIGCGVPMGRVLK